MDALRGDQLSLFPKDRTSELARAKLDTAWLVIQHRPYLTEAVIADLYALEAHFRETLVARCHAERIARDMLADLAVRPRYGLRSRPPAPPTLARIA